MKVERDGTTAEYLYAHRVEGERSQHVILAHGAHAWLYFSHASVALV